MNVVLNMTMSVNGIVADEHDSTAIFTRGEWPMFMEMARQAGALVWGRKTHEIVRSYGEGALQGFDGLTRIVVSHDPHLRLEPGWQAATSPQEAVSLLGKTGQAEAVLGGGSSLNSAFARAGLIDEVVIFMESLVAGRGVPVFSPEVLDLRLDLLEASRVDSELVRLRYKACKSL
jgi:dihydrofolate reductase